MASGDPMPKHMVEHYDKIITQCDTSHQASHSQLLVKTHSKDLALKQDATASVILLCLSYTVCECLTICDFLMTSGVA